MKKLSICMAVSAIAFVGCQNLELMDPASGVNDGSIRFGVNTPITRASNLWDNNNFASTAKKFKLAGVLDDGTEYLGTIAAPREIRYEGGEWTYDNKLFWPDATLDFYSWYTATTASTFAKGTYADANNKNIKISNYKVDDTVGSQEDFLIGAGKYSKSNVSTIYLKHALTKILFKAEVVSGSQLEVAVEAVRIVNIKNEGDLTVTPAATVVDAGKPTMKWVTTAAADIKNYTINTQNDNDGTKTNLTLTADAAGAANKSQYLFSSIKNVPEEAKASMLLLPQNFTAWNPANSDPTKRKIADNNGELLSNITEVGTFIGVKCTIKSTVGTDVYYHGSKVATKWLYIPVSSVVDMYGEWLANRAITYVITFGDAGSGSGGGGWTGDDPDDSGEVDPVLVPINFRTEVSDWDKFDVILQSVNFAKTGLDNTTTPAEMKKMVEQLTAEASYNPQKRYAANLKFTYQDGIVPNLNISASDVKLSDLVSNDKFLGGSTVKVDVSASAWTSGSVTLPALAGWALNGSPLSANGTVTYTKTEMAKIESNRLDAMPSLAIMKVAGEPLSNVSWGYSTFKGLKNTNDFLVLNFADLNTQTVTITGPATGFKMAVGATLDAAKLAITIASANTATATKDAKFLIIQKVTIP